jgi:two-component system, NarL family, nitrate/nitrite response regulator NarL
MAETRVLVIADNLLARVGLAALLSTQQDVTIVGQSSGGERLLSDVDVYRPEVVISDLGYDPLGCLPQLHMLVEARLPVVALLPDAESAGQVAGVLNGSPAYGLLLRDSDASLLTAALSAVAAGLVTLDPLLASAVRQGSEAVEPPAEDLTPREFEVLQLLAEGLTNKAIAQRLGISANTVKFHINAILQKLAAQSRTEAVVRASRLGLIIL